MSKGVELGKVIRFEVVVTISCGLEDTNYCVVERKAGLGSVTASSS